MEKMSASSRIEVWSVNYINDPAIREAKDKKATIIQIEPGCDPSRYMVEVVDCE